jgi:hypothetical protein
MNLPSWISTDSAVWFTFFASVSAYALSMVRSDNPAIPINLSTRGKLMLVTVLGMLQMLFQTKIGHSWTQAFITAIVSQSTALCAHGFRSSVTLFPGGGVAVPAIESSPAVVIPNVPETPAHTFGWLRFQNPIARVAMVSGMILVCFTTICVLLMSCTPAETALEQKIAECIIGRFSADVAGGMTDETAAIDTAAYCATTELTVKKTMKQHAADLALLRSDAGK